MTKYQKILLAVDFDNDAMELLEKYTEICSNSSEGILLNALDIPVSSYPLIFPAIGVAAENYEVSFKSMLKSRKKDLDDLICDSGVSMTERRVAFGGASDCIITLAERESADLIIIGAHGRSGLKRLLGSTASSVLNRARCDVLVVHFD